MIRRPPIKMHLEVLLPACLVLSLFLTGCCRRAPSSSPQYYERELVAMREAAIRAEEIKRSQPVMKDGYPWRGNVKADDVCLPCRINSTERSYKAEIDYLHEVVHGKKKTRVKFRD